ncbi:hypothetical protein [Nonomuraea aurantiaca]|uniref:hypothetical protein n=1 Tax=Nonomuraea aurantiaca TaxID=2878562 RepID=UPI001CD9F765|nr:hypothetical protein [Nonomuraea aurantiaca]MCA2224419.1 hypothetical protein [Nonomuraea aurantiaca]
MADFLAWAGPGGRTPAKPAVELFELDGRLWTHKRRWRYFALPILYGDRPVGELDTTTDSGGPPNG